MKSVKKESDLDFLLQSLRVLTFEPSAHFTGQIVSPIVWQILRVKQLTVENWALETVLTLQFFVISVKLFLVPEKIRSHLNSKG